ncbi:hypothetical protein C5S36_04185 [Candidatus Methanophagaceae archaeon]|nr:hypothetical protein C5S36_04185 [Methanophagales archaeon]
MILFKVQKTISFIPIDNPDPLMSDIFTYKYKSQEKRGAISGKSGERINFLSKLGYKIPVLENNENFTKYYMFNDRKLEKARRVRFPSPDDYNELYPNLSSLTRILNRINPGKMSSEPGHIRIKYKIIRRGLQKVAKYEHN